MIRTTMTNNVYSMYEKIHRKSKNDNSLMTKNEFESESESDSVDEFCKITKVDPDGTVHMTIY